MAVHDGRVAVPDHLGSATMVNVPPARGTGPFPTIWSRTVSKQEGRTRLVQLRSGFGRWGIGCRVRHPIVAAAIAGAIETIMACAGPAEKPPASSPEIALVEGGLLPQTLVEGEPGYPLFDRMRHHGVPGVSIAVIEDRTVVWSRHFGISIVADRRPVDDDTIFNVGSVTKAVTAVTILSLAQDGLVDLDGPVNNQLRSWRIPDNELTAQAEVTTIRLLNRGR